MSTPLRTVQAREMAAILQAQRIHNEDFTQCQITRLNSAILLEAEFASERLQPGMSASSTSQSKVSSAPGGPIPEEAFRRLIATVPLAVYTTDAEGRLTGFNAAAVALAGRVPEIGSDRWCITSKIYRPDGTLLPHEQCPMALALKGERVESGIECVGERPDGARFWFAAYPTVLRDERGHIQAGMNVLVDITARKRAQRSSEGLFRAMFDTTPECVKLVSVEGSLLQMNAAGLQMIGASNPADVIGKSVYDLIAPEHREQFREFNDKVCRGASGSLEFDVIGLEGRRRNMETHAVPLAGFDKSTVQLALTRDVTERKAGERASLLLKAIVDSSDDAIISKDLNGIITSWNKSAERLFGYTADEVIGKPVTILMPEDRVSEEPGILARLQAGQRVDHFETVRRCKDGTLLDISLTISPVKDAKGRVIGASKIARNITQARKDERARRLLSAIVDSSDDAIISKDLDGIITTWNRAAQRVFGYTADETIGQPVTMLFPAGRLDEEPGILARIRRGERVEHFETVRRRKDGTLIDVSLTISPVRDEDGRIVGASKIARDITERKRFESAMIESESRFRQLANSMPQIVWTAGADGHVDYYNDRWYQFTGFEPSTLDRKRFESIVHPDDLERWREGWQNAIAAARPYSGELRLWDQRKSQWTWLMARAVPAFDADGRPLKWFGSYTDIDEQKRVQEDLVRANKDLEQFAYSASHDLQEPLRTVQLYSEIVIRRYGDGLDQRALEFLGYVRSGASRMETLVRDLLSYTQVSRMDKPAEVTDARKAANAAVGALTGIISETGAQVTVHELPQVTVQRVHLEQIFQNLIGNALKYRHAGRTPEVNVRATRDHENWVFTVSDNGIGIDPEYKEKIFGLFKRLHTSDEYPGTGIGLAICQRIVDRYHGRIWVESEPGKGSSFHFTLPAQSGG